MRTFNHLTQEERYHIYLRAICAVTLARFTGEKGADISSQNIFLDDSQSRHLTILGAEYRKNSSEPVFRQ